MEYLNLDEGSYPSDRWEWKPLEATAEQGGYSSDAVSGLLGVARKQQSSSTGNTRRESAVKALVDVARGYTRPQAERTSDDPLRAIMRKVK